MARIMTPDELPDGATFGVFDELTPETIVVSEEVYDQFVEALNKPAKVSEGLRRLFEGKDEKDIS